MVEGTRRRQQEAACRQYGAHGADRVWNRIPEKIRGQIIEPVLSRPEATPRNLF
jgi:hypothetical protein